MSIDSTLTALAEALTRQAAAQERIADALEALKPIASNLTINVSGKTDVVAEQVKAAVVAASESAAKDAGLGETTAGDGAAQDPAKTTADSQAAGTAQDQGSAGTATVQAGSTATGTSDPAPAQQETPASEGVRKVSVDDARAALRDFSKKEGTPAALELLSSLGAKAISDLDEAGRVELMARIGGAA